MSDNNGFPNGWGEDEDDDYGYDTYDDEDEGASAWGSAAPNNTQQQIPQQSDNNVTNDSEVQNKFSQQNISQPQQPNVYYGNTAAVKGKSNAVKILVAIIIVLVLALGVLGAVLFMKNKKGDSNNSNETKVSEEELSTEDSSVSDEKSTAAETITESSENTETSETTQAVTPTTELTQPTTESSIFESEYTSAYEAAISDFKISENNTEFANAKYDLIDMNGDSVPELFISYEGIACPITDYYFYSNRAYIKNQTFADTVMVSSENYMIKNIGYGGGTGNYFYLVNASGEALKIDEMISYAGSYTHNDSDISEAEYNRLVLDYDKYKWDALGKYSIEYTNNQSNNNTSTNYQFIENAPADMYFYEDTGDYYDIPHGIVVTESTGLNMREGPGTNYESILEIPKGDEVDILGRGNDWCYVRWTVYGGVPKRAIEYYGYVKTDYLSISVG